VRRLVIASGAILLLLLSSAPLFAQTGTVSGTVTDAGTGAPVAGMTVLVTTVSGNPIAAALTNAAGAYTITGVPVGALYYVQTATSNGYLAEAFPDVQCVQERCLNELREAEPFSITPGGSVTARNFAVARGGRISGTVTSGTGVAVAGSTVVALARFGSQTFQFSDSTDAAGVYTIDSLPAGTYALHTSTGSGLVDEIYDNIPCPVFCSSSFAMAVGAPVPVSIGATTAGRDFRLETGGAITGVVTNAATGQPLPSVLIAVATRVNGVVVAAFLESTDANGVYTIPGLAAGSYSLFTSSATTTNEIYPDLLCVVNCSQTVAVDSGGRVEVRLGATTAGIVHALDPGLTVSGTVTNEVTGLPLQFAFVSAFLRAGQNFLGRSASTNAQGQYTIQGLVANTYVLATSISSQFVNEVYDDRPCIGNCSNAQLAAGTPVEVRPGVNTSGRNFALQPLPGPEPGQITGTITDSASGLPIAGMRVLVSVLSDSGTAGVVIGTTNVAGAYTITNLAAGSYRLSTMGPHPYRNEAFDNVLCLAECTTTIIAGSTPVNVAAGGTATANFALSAGDGISGVVTDSVTGAPLPGVTVTLIQVSSSLSAGSFVTNSRGQFYIRGVPNGQYVAFTSNSLGYFDEIHNNIPCVFSCSVATAIASGTRIAISGAAASAGADLAELVGGINFALNVRNQAPNAPSNLRIVTANSTATFTWTAPSLQNGGVPTSYLLEAGFSPNTTAVTLPIPGTGTTFAVPGVPPGRYFVRVKGVNAHGTGAASNEVLLVVGAGGVGLPDAPTNLNAFMAGDRIWMTWNAAVGGGPATGFVVEAGSASGASNIAAVNVSGASFTFSPVPSGFYFLRVRARNAAGVSPPSPEVMLVVGNVPAPPSSPGLSHSVSGSTVTLTWTAPVFGAVTGYVIEAGSATGLSNLAVVAVGPVLTQSFSGVPPGTYFVRVRAVNALGASIPSSERTVVVP
jgi:5-hydroxyisourate hydrolase-like protein (transthyretin family)